MQEVTSTLEDVIADFMASGLSMLMRHICCRAISGAFLGPCCLGYVLVCGKADLHHCGCQDLAFFPPHWSVYCEPVYEVPKVNEA